MNRQVESDHSGKGYERLVARAMRALFRMEDRGGTIVRNVVMKGASGTGHEVDLVLEIQHKDRLIQILAECKDYTRPVGKEKVAAFRTVLEDINALRGKGQKFAGILVSGSGFQSGALELARYSRILLLEIRKPDEREWQNYVRRFLKESRRQNPEGMRPTGLELRLRTNQRIRIVPDGKPDWEMGTPLSTDPDSLMIRDKTLREVMDGIPGNGSDGRRSVRMRPGVLHHMVLDGKMPVKEVVFSFDDLSEEGKDAVLYGRERPDLIISRPGQDWRIGVDKRDGSLCPMEY